MNDRPLSLKKISDFKWEIPTSFQDGMRVPGIIYADDELLGQITRDNAVKQVADVACLAGSMSSG